MYGNNYYAIEKNQEQYHQDLIEQANIERLLRLARSSRSAPAPLHRKALCWLGRQLIAWGYSLAKGGEAIPGELVSSSPDFSRL